ncbi:hypothetical protein [Rhodobacter sp. SY28-1]|uniref:hypothetical protein n=1 Tax=Rhodobacter sp. SY28-1 TaxID=2562317 RepID=UPI0010BFB546|nr:hypothetical protein [Rhodobacter sp. SY28-1]
MADSPLGNRPGKNRPEIWASGGQRPPFDLRALGRATVFLSRDLIAPLHAWSARRMRRAAINVKNGAGRIPADKLGRAERFVPSHLRVAAWMQNLAATLSHASATADPDVKRGNALVAEIGPHLWTEAPPAPEPEPAPSPDTPEAVAPVVLTEPTIPQPGDDPLASIRDEIAPGVARPKAGRPVAPDTPPAPPGPVTTGAIQVGGYLLGLASVAIALPYGLARSLWLWVGGRDLKGIGRDD